MKGRAPTTLPFAYEQHIHIDNDLAMQQLILLFKNVSIENLLKISTMNFFTTTYTPPGYLKYL